ncbi:MAG: DUF3883 domain-containing protein [Actinomycetota bacterium]|nr:MAG: DUF3883 domain-containing protein [Actinomycetota bacterium]
MDAESPIERALAAALENLVPGVRAAGVATAGVVDIVAARWVGTQFLEVTYRDGHGDVGQAMLGRDDEPRLRLESAGTTRAFDADGALWRLAAEALRIRYAALFDPMVAVSTSELEALPHQLTAVYGELLPRSPLRFLLADDPGAGKTIMAGLYIKELRLRGDLARCLIVAPGSLVDQWQDELHDKFGLDFEVLTRPMIDATTLGSNVFDQHPLLIARMDQLSRNDDLRGQLDGSDWDLVVVDEAHRMSAHYFGNELTTTKRYELGRSLGRVTRHLLLMTATPHSGKQEDFQLFLALLDGDRFEGRFRDGLHSAQPGDLMRRMVKEELLTMDGRPLFPERRASTVPYELSAAEKELYDVVTAYVREEMGRADALGEGDRRRTNVGFALTVLQRRLASSPEAILRSLQRRRDRLGRQLQTIDRDGSTAAAPLRDRLAEMLGRDVGRIDDALEDMTAEEVEQVEDTVTDAATAARTRTELQHEIGVLDDLIEVARRVRQSDTDRKWTELRTILLDEAMVTDSAGTPRKIIVFTEHKDTLNYLVDRIGTLLGDDRTVVAIHGGVRREDRRTAQELFTSDPQVRILVATDAAGEGLNLQRAHLMVNYDLPWNPNKIEQRFGRIHRIGQTEVCHLWNLVARDTREGDVFLRLLAKVDEQREAYGGKVFDVLGDAFEGRPLRELLIEAIRYGDLPETREHLNRVIDASVNEGIEALLAERALEHDVLAQSDPDEVRRRVEEAQARRLQPHYIRAFFAEAFERMGGQLAARERGRHEITHVPARIRDRDRQAGIGAAVLTRYERVCFERNDVRRPGLPVAQLLAPGHPLLDAVVDLTVNDHSSLLKHGAVLVDPDDLSSTPRLLVASIEEIKDGRSRTVSKRFGFVELDADGVARTGGPAPYLDYAPWQPAAGDQLESLLGAEWLTAGVEDVARAWAVQHSLPDHRRDVETRVVASVARTRDAVRARLTSEINYWDGQHALLLDQESAGRQLRMRPETAYRRARDLEGRLQRRLAELDVDAALTVLPPVISGAALVIPQGLLDRWRGASVVDLAASEEARRAVERRAVDAVLAAERKLGAVPEEMPPNNPGFDVRSVRVDGSVIRIEVKGRIAGADEFSITRNEVLTAKNLGDDYRLALVEVSPEGAGADRLRYVRRPFDATGTDDFRLTRYVFVWRELWSEGGGPG